MTMILKKGIDMSKQQINRALRVIRDLDSNTLMYLESNVRRWAIAQETPIKNGNFYGDEHSAYMMGRVHAIIEMLEWRDEITREQVTLLTDYYTDVSLKLVDRPEDVEEK